MKPLPSQWLRLAEPYRNGEWLECLEILRPLVEANPDDLGSRMLYGALCLTTEQGARALVQFEKLLPLAVGQGDLFRALGAQKQMDRLRPEAALHEKRYVAIHQWFRAVRVRGARAAGGVEFTPAALLALPPPGFHRVAEEAAIEDLGLESREVEGSADVVRVVLYGRVRWSVTPEGEGSLLEVTAEEGDAIAIAPGVRGRLRLAPELPAACLRFDLGLLREEREKAGPSRGRGATTSRNAPGGRESDPAHAEGTSGPRRPVPDPLLEPTVAVAAPFERRRDTRVSLSFETRVAMLGLAGSRVAPFAGRLVSLSPSGLGLAFPRAELIPVRDTLEGSLLTVEIQLADGEPPLRLTSRVRWVQLAAHDAGAAGDETGALGLEFILVGARDHVRIQAALIAAARAGQPLDSRADASNPEAGSEAA